MDWDLLVSGTSAVFAGIALVIAVLSRRDSKRANSLAGEANDIAGSALGASERANEFAGQANKFAEDANSISRRALAATEDNLIYQWRIDIDDDTGSTRLVNDSAHDALQVSVVVVDEGGPVDRGWSDRVPAYEEIVLDVSSTLEKHFEEVDRHPSRPAKSGNGIFISGSFGKTVETVLTFQITWKTIEDVRRDLVLEKALRHGDHYGTVKRR